MDANTTKFEQDQLYRPLKIVVIGDGAVGKTSLIKWYVIPVLNQL